jgi:hypothetical protein
VRTYEHCRELLANELGISPDPDTVALHADISGNG